MNILGALKGGIESFLISCLALALVPAALSAADSNAVPAGDPPIATNVVPAPGPKSATNAAPATNAIPVAKPTKPEVVASFRTRPGFKIELVASDPSVASPAAMAFDEDGRLFVAEIRDYPSRRDQQPHLGQIRVLEDPNGEGVFGASTVFATNLPLPSAIVCYGGGVFVAAAPNIIFLQDSDGNGVTDVQRIVLTGFGETNAINPNALPHSFYWGMDNRIYGASGGAVTTAKASGNADSGALLAGRDFSFDPRGLSLSSEAGTALSGMTRDDWGRRFLCSNARPLQAEVIEERYIWRNPYFAPALLVQDMAGPAVPLFHYEDPSTTKAIAAARSTNEYAPTWLANARGAVVYRGSLFPSNYYGNIFVADADARVIHRAIIREQGFALRAQRAPEERNTEFLIATDTTFRPTQVVCGPDGALYVADMATGGDRGRIYRIATSGYTPSKPRRLSEASTRDLVTLLAVTNGFDRDTASRLIFERRDPAASPLLSSMAARSRLPLARAQALQVLAGTGGLTETQTAQAMGDPDWRVRVKAIALAEGFVREGAISDLLWARMRSLGTDPMVQVRLQTALSSGAIVRPDKPVLLRDVLARDPTDPWVRTAILSSAHDGAATLLGLLAAEPRVPDAVKGPLLSQIADMIGVSGNMGEVRGCIDFILGERTPELLSLRLAAALGEGLHRTRSSLRLVDTEGRLARLFAAALNAASNWNYSEAARLAAIQVLGTGPYTMNDGGKVLLMALNSREPPSIQAAALRSLSFYNSPELTPGIVERWAGIAPALRGEAIATLLARADQAPIVLTLIENGNIPAADVPLWQANLFRTLSEPTLSQRAVRIFGPLNLERPGVTEQLRPVLSLTGVPSRGQGIFASRCSACHNMRAPWPTPGPDLAGTKVLGKEAILQAILEPSKRIVPGHVTVILRTLTGDMAVGTLARETPDSIVICQPGKTPVVWPRLNVESVEAQRWSLMPEGLEQGLGNQGIADLIQYLIAQ